MVDTVIVESDAQPASAVSWPAVIAGGFVAGAITLLLLALGAGIGFSVVSPWSGAPDISSTKAATVAGIYMCVTAVMASALGGYITGRLRVRWAGAVSHEAYFRDTAHGLLAWAFATVLGAALLGSAATAITSGAASGSRPAALATSTTGSGANDVVAPYLDRLFRPDYGALSRRQPAVAAVGGRDLGADRDDARRILASPRDLSDDDRQFLAQMVSARTGLPQADAEKRVTTVHDELRAALDQARRISMHLSFWLVASMFLGALAAALAATEGGAQRDGRDFL
ncbi:MAG: hypothetical protein JOY64_33725 [Alphaproteobacteria bacterium]|nr:hypothetical protein [Alphaproteobacteria bacterium]MBV8412625.1 hypothetical protein [Alphaproteobacteria bacterium]